MTVLIKNLAQKVDFWAKSRSNQDCRSICAGTVCTQIEVSTSLFHHFHQFLGEGYSGEWLGLFG